MTHDDTMNEMLARLAELIHTYTQIPDDEKHEVRKSLIHALQTTTGALLNQENPHA